MVYPSFGGADESFQMFDALLYKNKPDLALYGLKPLRILYAPGLWDKGESQEFPNERKIAEIAKTIKPYSLVCIDIEHWDVKNSKYKESIQKFRKVAEIIKNVNPTVRLGFYGLPPIRDYWRAIGNKNEAKHQKWMQENENLKPMSEFIDVVFPSLYTFYPLQKGWKKYAIKNIQEARKYGKLVYVFLWPMYHESSVLNGLNISSDFWRFQLETCKENADGVVIWGGWDIKNKKKYEWNENSRWWRETKDFMAKDR